MIFPCLCIDVFVEDYLTACACAGYAHVHTNTRGHAITRLVASILHEMRIFLLSLHFYNVNNCFLVPRVFENAASRHHSAWFCLSVRDRHIPTGVDRESSCLTRLKKTRELLATSVRCAISLTLLLSKYLAWWVIGHTAVPPVCSLCSSSLACS